MPAVIIFGLVLVALYLYGSSASAATQETCGVDVSGNTYGFAINNPGNLRWIANPAQRWQGMIENVNGYAKFDSLQNGVRAIGKQLQVDYNRGADTVSKLITIWAPSSDNNNTQAYIDDVSQRIGVDADSPFAFQDMLPDLTAAIIIHENGYNSIDAGDLITYINS